MCTVGMSWCIKQQGPVVSSSFSPVVLMSATVFDFLILHREIYLGRYIIKNLTVLTLYFNYINLLNILYHVHVMD